VTILAVEESYSAQLPEPDAVVHHSTQPENQPVQIDGEWTLEEILAREG
jgi:hypothetical protein